MKELESCNSPVLQGTYIYSYFHYFTPFRALCHPLVIRSCLGVDPVVVWVKNLLFHLYSGWPG